MRRPGSVLITAACAAGLIVSTPSAQAASPPQVSMSPARTRISAAGRSTYDYAATHLRRGTRIVLQSLDDGTWDTIASSAPRHGTARGTFRIDGPGEPGTFSLRAAALRHGKIDAASARHLIYAFGRVSLLALCHGVLHRSLVNEGDTCSKASGTGKHFRAVLATGESTPREGFVKQFGAPHTSCRSITLRYVPDVAGPVTLTLRQRDAKPQKHRSPGRGVGTFAAKLTGKKFAVSVSEADNDLLTEFNGSASCYTSDGGVVPVRGARSTARSSSSGRS